MCPPLRDLDYRNLPFDRPEADAPTAVELICGGVFLLFFVVIFAPIIVFALISRAVRSLPQEEPNEEEERWWWSIK